MDNQQGVNGAAGCWRCHPRVWQDGSGPQHEVSTQAGQLQLPSIMGRRCLQLELTFPIPPLGSSDAVLLGFFSQLGMLQLLLAVFLQC